jgi:hypothetical protein
MTHTTLQTLERLTSSSDVKAFEAHSDRQTRAVLVTLTYAYTSQTVNLCNLNPIQA